MHCRMPTTRRRPAEAPRRSLRRARIAVRRRAGAARRSAPARTIVEPHGERASRSRPARPSSAMQYVKTTHRRSRRRPARRWRCPARCRATCSRRSRRARAATCKRWTKDIGSRVQEGRAARRDRDARDRPAAVAGRSPRASRRRPASALAKSTVERWEALRKKDAVSQQELDERRSARRAGAAPTWPRPTPTSQRLRQLEGFKRVVAPFAGVITRRNVDVGDLIDAGGGAAARCSCSTQTDPLRVYVNVPQSYAQLVKPGQPVDRHAGRAARPAASTARSRAPPASIDAATRTMQVEVALPNPDGALLPGAYVQVALPLAGEPGARRCPTNALMFRGEGTRVAVVDAQGRVHLQPVTLGRNFGETVEVLDGVSRQRPAGAESVRFAGRRRPGRDRARRRAGRAARRGSRAVTGQRREALRRRGRSPLALARAAAGAAAPPAPTTAGRRSTMPAAWKLEAPWREGTPGRRGAEGPVVAALRRPAARRAAASRRWPAARRWRSPARAWRRRAPSLAPASAGLLSAARPERARARASASRRTGRSPTTTRPTSRRCRTTSRCRSAVELRGRPRRPRAAHDRGRARRGRAVGGRLRERAAAARRRPGDRLLQPARARHRARRAGALDRAAAPRARAGRLRATTSAPRRASTSRSSRRCSTPR